METLSVKCSSCKSDHIDIVCTLVVADVSEWNRSVPKWRA